MRISAMIDGQVGLLVEQYTLHQDAQGRRTVTLPGDDRVFSLTQLEYPDGTPVDMLVLTTLR